MRQNYPGKLETIQAVADLESGTSRSALLREALEDKLKAAAQENTPSLYERSADLCGKGNSGLGDLASNPKHLEGFGS